MQCLRFEVADSVALYPGIWANKWTINEQTLVEKLAGADNGEILKLAEAVTRFWDECEQGKGMDAYYPIMKKAK